MPDPGVSTQAILVLKADIQDLLAKINRVEKEYGDLKESGVENFSKTGAKALELNAVLELLKKGAKALGRIWKATVGEVVTTAADFQILQTRLTALYRDVDIAAEKFNKLKVAAKQTPFRLKNIVEAQAQLKAFGFVGDETIKMAADLAAFMGEDIVFAANSMGRAFAGGAGAADILRERGVLTLIKLKAGISDLKSLTLPEFRKALIATMQDPMYSIAGAAEKLMQTYRGAFSNLQDALDIFKNNLGMKILPALTKLIKISEKAVRGVAEIFSVSTTKRIEDQQLELNSYVKSLLDVTTSEDERVVIIKKLNPLLSKYLGLTVDLATDSATLEEILKKINNQFERQLEIEIAKNALAEYNDVVAKNLKSLVKSRLEYNRYKSSIELSGYSIAGARDKIIDLDEAVNSARLAFDAASAAEMNIQITPEQTKQAKLITWERLKQLANAEKERKEFNDIALALDNIDKLEGKITKKSEKLVESKKEQARAVNALNYELDKAGGLINAMAESGARAAGDTGDELKKIFSSINKDYSLWEEKIKQKNELSSQGLDEEIEQLGDIRDARSKIIFTDSTLDKNKADYLELLKAEYLLLVKIGLIQDENSEKIKTTVDIAKTLSDAIWDGVSGAESLGDAVVEMFKKIANQILQDLILYIIGLLITGGGSAMAPIIGSMGGLTRGIGGAVGLPGFKDGADFTVGGKSGIDKNIVAFKASRGERVTVTPANQFGKANGMDLNETNYLLRELVGKFDDKPVISKKMIGEAIHDVLKSYGRSRA